MEEVVADERFVVADGRCDEQRITEIGVEVAPSAAVDVFKGARVDVAELARELEVAEEALGIIDAFFAVVIEAEVEDAGFERVVRRRQRAGEGVDAIQPGLALGFVEFEVHIGAGGQFAQVGVNERGVGGVLVFQLVELGEQKLTMDRQIAKCAALIGLEVRTDGGDEVRHIGVLEFLQHGAALIRRERHLIANERRDRLLREALEAAVVVQRVA